MAPMQTITTTAYEVRLAPPPPEAVQRTYVGSSGRSKRVVRSEQSRRARAAELGVRLLFY
jgi:hypothetical protein